MRLSLTPFLLMAAAFGGGQPPLPGTPSSPTPPEPDAPNTPDTVKGAVAPSEPVLLTEEENRRLCAQALRARYKNIDKLRLIPASSEDRTWIQQEDCDRLPAGTVTTIRPTTYPKALRAKGSTPRPVLARRTVEGDAVVELLDETAEVAAL